MRLVDTVRATYNTTSGREYTKSLRLWAQHLSSERLLAYILLEPLPCYTIRGRERPLIGRSKRIEPPILTGYY